MRETPLAAGSLRLPRTPLGGAYSAPPDTLAGGEGLAAPRCQPFGPPTLALRASLLASPNPFTIIRLCSELNLF